MTLISSLLGGAILVLLGLALSVSGCASPSISAYKDQAPKVDMREYFQGKLVAVGTIQDYSGKVVSRFTADIVGNFEKDKGTLNEEFTFDDGKKETRNWSFDIAEDGSFTGSAHDVVGKATGKQSGNAIFMNYVLRRTIDGREMEFSMDDRLYLINDTYMMNQTKMRKFGITVAELNIAFHKVK